MLISEQLTTVESRIANRSFTLELPSEFEWVNRTVSYLEQHALSLSWGDAVNGNRVSLSLHEALTNAIVHGNLEVSSDLKEADEAERFAEALAVRSTQNEYSSRRVQVLVEHNEHRIVWTITDEGKGFDVAKVLERAESEEPSMLASGRGVMMMKAFMDDVQYELGGRRCRMTLCNPDAEQIVGLGARDWSDLREIFGLVSPSFEVGASSDDKPQSEKAQLQMNLALAPLLSLLSKDDGPGHEQRKHERLYYTGRFMVHDAGNEPRPAYARNISVGGLGFLCEAPFSSRDITIELDINGTPVRLQSEIVRCTELIPNVYDVGVKFIQTTERPRCLG